MGDLIGPKRVNGVVMLNNLLFLMTDPDSCVHTIPGGWSKIST